MHMDAAATTIDVKNGMQVVGELDETEAVVLSATGMCFDKGVPIRDASPEFGDQPP